MVTQDFENFALMHSLLIIIIILTQKLFFFSRGKKQFGVKHNQTAKLPPT